MTKYIKPGSVTWWASIAPLLAGLFIAFTPVHGNAELAEVIREIFGGASAGVLINIGIGGIGVRGAMG